MHQLAREVWFYEAAWGLAALGYLSEPLYLRLYRRQPALVLSESTRGDLLRLGFDSDRIHLLDGATDAANSHSSHHKRVGGSPREFSFVYVGRLTPSKRVHDIIAALGIARRSLLPSGISPMLRIAGSGPADYERRLQDLARRLGVSESVEFHGWKHQWWLDATLASSDALVMASVREGWGLVVTEANAIGIPAIGYPVHGLRDSIQDGITGLLTKKQDSRSLATEMIKLASSPDLLDRLAQAARNDAASRDWRSSRGKAVLMLAEAASQLDRPIGSSKRHNAQLGGNPVGKRLQVHLSAREPVPVQ